MGQSTTDAPRPLLELVASEGQQQQAQQEPGYDSGISFDDFWLLYPRRAAKLDARKAWSRIDADLHVTILVALAAWRPVWREKEVEYLPLPATYLRGERWEDELPPQYRARAPDERRAPDRPFAAMGPRPEIPEHVKSLLAKLKGAKP